MAVRGGGFPKAGEAGWSWVSEVLGEVDLTPGTFIRTPFSKGCSKS